MGTHISVGREEQWGWTLTLLPWEDGGSWSATQWCWEEGKGMNVFKDEDEDDDENERDDVQAAMTMYHVLWEVLLWANHNNCSVRQTLLTPPLNSWETDFKRISNLSNFPQPASGREQDVSPDRSSKRLGAENTEMPPVMRLQTWKGLPDFPLYLPSCCPHPVAQMVKSSRIVQETWVWSLGWEDPLEKGMATTPGFLPGEFLGQMGMVGYSPRGHKESDPSKWVRLSFSLSAHTPRDVVNTQKLLRHLIDGKGSENVSMFPKIRSVDSSCCFRTSLSFNHFSLQI